MDLPKRKPTRLKNYDYSTDGYYFITICTHKKQKILCDIVGVGLCALPYIKLTAIGETVKKSIEYINENNDNIFVDKYVIMPDHIHLLLSIKNNGTSWAPSPTNQLIPHVVSTFKRFCNKEIGSNIFQRSYYDHIIRNQNDYDEVWYYIDNRINRRWHNE